jgi:pSer/pThr/pTyr-binding forkhead associated (FHA) protein
MTELATALSELDRSGAELRGRYAELEPANTKLQAVVLESNKTIERLSSEVHRAETSSDRFAHQLAEQKNVEKSLRSELAAAQTEKADLAEQIEQLANSLEVARKELVSGAEMHNVKADLDREQANAAKLRADIEERDGQIAELFREIDKAVRQTGDARAAASQLDSRLRAVGDEHEKALAQLKQEWIEVTEENDRIHGMMEQRESEMAAVRMEMQQIQAGRQELVDEIDSLKCLIEELELELRNKRMLIATLERDGGRRAANDTTQAMQVTETADAVADRDPDAFVQPRSLIAQDQRRKQYPLVKPTITLGRSSDCDIRLGGSYTSRHHARLVTDRSGTTIEDLDSINGVQVNSQTVKTRRLHDGDTIQIGQNLFTFVDPDEAQVAGH